jgi:uncharacterized membrane protein
MTFLADPYITFFIRWLHVVCGVMWIGLLWYFNFVQTPSMPKIPDEQKPAITKVIAPTALFWFRWSALATIVLGLIQAWQLHYIQGALSLGFVTHSAHDMRIGFGMWMGLIMAFNVWFLIWPNQQKTLGLVQATPEEKTRAARVGFLASRVNTMLSIPMLYAMVGASHMG